MQTSHLILSEHVDEVVQSLFVGRHLWEQRAHLDEEVHPTVVQGTSCTYNRRDQVGNGHMHIYTIYHYATVFMHV